MDDAFAKRALPQLWSVLASCRPELAELAAWLEARGDEELEDFARIFERAKEAIANYSAPPPSVGHFSEDDMEDLCAWIVSQGEELWLEATSSEAGLDAVARIYCDVESGTNTRYARRWNRAGLSAIYDGYRSPALLAHGLYFARHGRSLREVLDR